MKLSQIFQTVSEDVFSETQRAWGYEKSRSVEAPALYLIRHGLRRLAYQELLRGTALLLVSDPWEAPKRLPSVR